LEQCNKMHWTLCALIIGSFGCKYIHAQAQRIAPGVPPQHYQQVDYVCVCVSKHMVELCFTLRVMWIFMRIIECNLDYFCYYYLLLYRHYIATSSCFLLLHCCLFCVLASGPNTAACTACTASATSKNLRLQIDTLLLPNKMISVIIVNNIARLDWFCLLLAYFNVSITYVLISSLVDFN